MIYLLLHLNIRPSVNSVDISHIHLEKQMRAIGQTPIVVTKLSLNSPCRSLHSLKYVRISVLSDAFSSCKDRIFGPTLKR